MTRSLEKESSDNNTITIWKIPPNTRLNFKLRQERNSGTWRYSVLNSGLSALSSSLPAEQSGEVFAPSLHTLKSRLDAVPEQPSALLDPEVAWAGSKRKLQASRENYCLPSDGAANYTKLKSSVSRQRTFRTSAVRTSTQRRVRFLPETGFDPYVIESSSFPEESDELTFPPFKKRRVSFGGSEVIPATGAGPQTHRSTTCGEREIPNRDMELSKSAQSSPAFVTPNLIKDFVHEKGVRTTEYKADSKSRPSADGTSQENSCKSPTSGTASSSVISCKAKTNESRYSTLRLNLKRPELVTSVETSNKRVRRNADQTIPVFGPTAGHGCAGPVCDPNESEGANRTRVAPYCESSPRPQDFLEDSLVQDSQEENELEDLPVVHKTSKNVVPWKGGDNCQQYVQQSVTAEGPYKLTGNNDIESVSNVKRAQYEKQLQGGRQDANCSSDACRQEGAVLCCSGQTASQTESVTTIRAKLRCGDSWPEPTNRGEFGVRVTSNEKSSAPNLSCVLGLSGQANSILDKELRRPGSAGNVNSILAQVPDESGKCPGPDLLSNVFRTGRGNLVQISSSAMNRVNSLFDDDSVHPETRADNSVPVKCMPRAKPVAVSSALADAESLLSVRKNLYTHSLSVPEPDGLLSLDLVANNGTAVEDNMACLFQTGRGEPVNIFSESMRRVQSLFATRELSPPAEAGRFCLSSAREASCILNHEPPSNGQSSLPISGREEFLNFGDGKATIRDSHEAGGTSAGANLLRSSLFRTGRDTPVSISSAALQKMRSIFEGDELHVDTESSKLESKQTLGEAERRERSNYLGYQLDKNFGPPPGLNVETPAVRDSYQPSAAEFGRTVQTTVDAGIEKATSYTAGRCHTEASDWSFSFKGTRGHTLRVSSAAKAKAEALLKLGPQFLASPNLEARGPSFEGCVKASSVAPSSLDGDQRRYPASRIKEGRKQVNRDLARKTPRLDTGGERGTTPGFKSPRLIRPSPSLCDGQNYVGLQSATPHTTRRNCLLPVTLHYLHKKISRSERGRLSMLEYFGGPPRLETKTLSGLPKEVLSVTADTAETCRIPDGISSVGVEDMLMMLKDLGADQRYASQGWVANHFRWIVWKLASYERKFPHQHGRLLTLSAVLNELKYRYDRELNGERSALKRVTEKDAAASHTMVLCVAAVRSVKDVDHFYETWTEKGDSTDETKRKPPSAGVIEVTDGWYRLNAHIDVPLARRIHSGKLKAGQKIVVCGATLKGLSDGLPPLQAYHNAYLCVNSNGVRRARWDQRLGFCGAATPLAFKCITQDGGVIPHTYVAVARRYPVLHREKLASGGYILRSSRAEDQAAHDFDQRRAKVAEEVMQKLEYCHTSTDEGATLCAALETAADPESLLLDMTRAQLDVFAAFKARREESMQIAAGELIKAAFASQGLATREVVPTFKVRVVGLIPEGDIKSDKEGLVTIWQATEELQELLQEGKVFCVCGLHPSTKGSYQSFKSTRWRPVSRAALEKKFRFPYISRAPIRISNLSEYMSCREFDVAGLVLFVTDPIIRDVFRGRTKCQWVFMTDGSRAKGNAADAWEETQVLAVEVSWSIEGFVPLESTLVGSVVGYCNLWLKHRDHSNRLWVAEASDRAHYSTKMTSLAFRHLSSAACEVQNWAQLNSWNVDILQSDVEELAVHFRSTATSSQQ